MHKLTMSPFTDFKYELPIPIKKKKQVKVNIKRKEKSIHQKAYLSKKKNSLISSY